MSMNLVTTAVPGRVGLLHPGAQGPVASDHVASGQPVRDARHGVWRFVTTVGLVYKLAALSAADGVSCRHRLRDHRSTGRRHRRLDHGQARRDDQDAGAGGVHAQHDRPGCGVHRHRRSRRAAVAGHRANSWATAIPTGNRLELFLGAAIGAITFSGSVIAFGKLSGKYKFRLFQGAPVQFAGQHKLNLQCWVWRHVVSSVWSSCSPAA
jgi:hypothetical protein